MLHKYRNMDMLRVLLMTISCLLPYYYNILIIVSGGHHLLPYINELIILYTFSEILFQIIEITRFLKSEIKKYMVTKKSCVCSRVEMPITPIVVASKHHILHQLTQRH